MDRYRDRTVDQMEQAARSGKQNIVEGYSDAEGSTEVEHKLTVIAKGSLEELKEDYRDYLRTHKLEIWGPQHAKYQVCQPLFRSITTVPTTSGRLKGEATKTLRTSL